MGLGSGMVGYIETDSRDQREWCRHGWKRALGAGNKPLLFYYK
jgi:hypothetical protein